MKKQKLIVKVSHEVKYTVITNSLLEDPRLSFQGKGMVCYLISKPDDWETRLSHLETVGPDGEAAVASTMKELVRLGYATKKLIRDDKGHIIGTQWTIYEVPQGSPVKMDSPPETRFSSSGFPGSGKSRTTKYGEVPSTDRTKKEEEEGSANSRSANPEKTPVMESKPDAPTEVGGAPENNSTTEKNSTTEETSEDKDLPNVKTQSPVQFTGEEWRSAQVKSLALAREHGISEERHYHWAGRWIEKVSRGEFQIKSDWREAYAAYIRRCIRNEPRRSQPKQRLRGE